MTGLWDGSGINRATYANILCTSLWTDDISTSSLNFYRWDALPDAQATGSKTEGTDLGINLHKISK